LNLEDGLTKKQKEALDVVSSGAHNILLYGGARSGKTFFTCLVIVYLAAKYDGSRHLIARLRYAHARNSIWLDTLKNVIEYMGLSAAVKWNETDHYVKIGNSEIWVDGLDDRDRVDKILGREYATIYLNEVSQIPWQTVTTVMTRLA
jgi:PBSX family phage terminase large subunit